MKHEITAEKFTAGPWEALPSQEGRRQIFVTEWRHNILDHTAPGINAEANANLAASAPELYAALKELLTASEIVDGSEAPDVADINHLLECHEQARKALAKARGE